MDRIEFNKKFANGEQYIRFDASTDDIKEDSKSYYWEEREIYNIILPLVELLKIKLEKVENLEQILYGENGFVERCIPIQRVYNKLKNRKIEYIQKLVNSVVLVEDGSVDVDNLEDEGLAPGKILVYRNGSTPPNYLLPDERLYKILENEEEKLATQVIGIYEHFLNLYE